MQKRAAHKVRITEEGLVEESICVPPESTLLRLDRSLEISESDLIKLLEKEGFIRDPDVLDTGSLVRPLAFIYNGVAMA